MGKTFDGTVTEVSLQALTEVAGKELPKERAPHGSDTDDDTDDDDQMQSLQARARNHE
jgi:hypothetical protein